MDDLIEILESFNRKERFFLIGDALGNKEFQLSEGFRLRLSEEVGIEVPAVAFVAMDYHLDWISTSLFLFHTNSSEDSVWENEGVIDANQEDADLLVAFANGGLYHVILLEVKGYTGWSNEQMRSKANRLRRIFGDDGGKYREVMPHYCLMSPRRPQQLDVRAWPAWMSDGGRSPNWIPMNLPAKRRKPTRCDATQKASAIGGYFCIETVDVVSGSRYSTRNSVVYTENHDEVFVGTKATRTGGGMGEKQRAFGEKSSRWEFVRRETGSFRDPFNRFVKNGIVVRDDDGVEYVVGRGFAQKYLGLTWV